MGRPFIGKRELYLEKGKVSIEGTVLEGGGYCRSYSIYVGKADGFIKGKQSLESLAGARNEEELEERVAQEVGPDFLKMFKEENRFSLVELGWVFAKAYIEEMRCSLFLKDVEMVFSKKYIREKGLP